MLCLKNTGPRVGILVIAMLAGIGSAAADPHPMTAGMNPRPTTSTRVAIVREELLINIGSDHAEVTAALWLKNLGKEETLQVGFPCDVNPDEHVSTLPCQTTVQVALDGRKVALKKRPTSKTIHDWVWSMRLAEGEEAKLDIAYRAPLSNERYDEPIEGMEALFYRLVTGAAWFGPIGELEIEVRTPADGLAFIAPAGYTRLPGKIRWSLTNYEPTEDLLLLFAGSAGFTTGLTVNPGLAEWERIHSVDRAQAIFGKEVERLLSVRPWQGYFGGQWRITERELGRCLEESKALIDEIQPKGWRFFQQAMTAKGLKLPPWEAARIYFGERGYLSIPDDKPGQGVDGPVAVADRMAHEWLDRMRSDPGLAVHVAAARALGGDPRGATLLRSAVADGPPVEVARGLAALRIPVCPLIEEHLPDAWETYVKKTTPPAIEPGTFGLSRALAQQETRLRLLELMSEGADGACLDFVTAEAASNSVSGEERALAQAILQKVNGSSTAPPTLGVLNRRLSDRHVHTRLAAVGVLAARQDAPARRFRAALRHSEFCEARVLAGATLEEALDGTEWRGCVRKTLGILYSNLLAAGNLHRAASLLPQVLREAEWERDRIRHLGEWLGARAAPARRTP